MMNLFIEDDVTTMEIDLLPGDEGIISQVIPLAIEIAVKNSKIELILDTAQKLQGDSSEQTVKNIFDYVCANYPFLQDYGSSQYVIAPRHILSGKIKNQRDGLTLNILLASLLIASNFKVFIELDGWDALREFRLTHIYLSCKLPGLEDKIYLDVVNEAFKQLKKTPTPVVVHKIFEVN